VANVEVRYDDRAEDVEIGNIVTRGDDIVLVKKIHDHSFLALVLESLELKVFNDCVVLKMVGATSEAL